MNPTGDDRHEKPEAGRVHIARVDPASAEARWCVAQYFAELDRRFEGGFDPARAIAADEDSLRPPRGSFLLATADGEPVASGCLKTFSPGIGLLTRMWVAPSARGLGLGRRLLGALESEARELGFATLRLDTHRALTEAVRLYLSAGYAEIPRFHDNPYAHHWFEKRLG